MAAAAALSRVHGRQAGPEERGCEPGRVGKKFVRKAGSRVRVTGHSFVWAVTRDNMRWERIVFSEKTGADKVTDLRRNRPRPGVEGAGGLRPRPGPGSASGPCRTVLCRRRPVRSSSGPRQGASGPRCRPRRRQDAAHRRPLGPADQPSVQRPRHRLPEAGLGSRGLSPRGAARPAPRRHGAASVSSLRALRQYVKPSLYGGGKGRCKTRRMVWMTSRSA
jgi:hypothetical protein